MQQVAVHKALCLERVAGAVACRGKKGWGSVQVARVLLTCRGMLQLGGGCRTPCYTRLHNIAREAPMAANSGASRQWRNSAAPMVGQQLDVPPPRSAGHRALTESVRHTCGRPRRTSCRSHQWVL